MDNRSPEMLKPTLLAGVVFGTLGGLPFFSLLNCACCALVIGCGFFAAYLYSGVCRRQGAEFRPGTGAVVGLVAGAFYAMVATLVGTVANVVLGGDPVVRAIVEALQNMPSIPPEQQEMFEKMVEQSGNISIVEMVFGFFINLLLGAIFATVGGLVGGAVFKVSPPRPTPPMFGGDLSAPPPSGPAV